MRPKNLNNKDPWVLAEKIPDMDIFFSEIFMSAFANDSSYPFIKNYNKIVAIFDKFDMSFYFGKENSYQVAESILNALASRPKFGSDLNKNIVVWSKKLELFAVHLKLLPFKKYANHQLLSLYKKHDAIHTKLYTYGWLPVAVDMFHNNMTDYLKGRLEVVCSNEKEINDAFILLTTPIKKSIIAKEREEFLSIYKEAQKDFSKKKKLTINDLPLGLSKKLARHKNRWGHLGYIYAGNVKSFSVDYYFGEMVNLYKTKINLAKLVNQEKEQSRMIIKKQKAFYKKFKLTINDKRLFGLAQDFALTKLIRRSAQLLDLLLVHKYLLAEVARRLNLTRYQVQFMLPREIERGLIKDKVDTNLLSERLKICVCYTEKNFEQIYVGSDIKPITKQLPRKTKLKLTEIKGQTAQSGQATGRVKIIIRATDIGKMKKGDILISIATDPDIVPAMKKAAAIVTEQGGITSHAAIVSRELGIPCVIGTKIATEVFKDGDMVEVDADRGIVKKLS